MFEFLINHTPLLYLTQSLWRDEAFSVLMSEPPLGKILKLTSDDFTPPLYYFLLHFWMKIFGETEILIRMLSFIFHAFLVYVVFLFFKKLNSNYKLGTTLVAFNPLLLYFAFEARMYSLLAFLSTLSMYSFFRKNWPLYIFSSTLALYTHPFAIFVLLTQGLYLLIAKGSLGKRFLEKTKNEIFSFFLILLCFSPWIPILIRQALKTSKMWIYPVDFNLVLASLGNLFTGFEGTPYWFWPYTKVVSSIILLFSLLVLKKSFKKGTRPWVQFKGLLFFLWLFVPLTLVLTISFFKPIYVNRYLIYLAVAEVFILVLGLETIKNRTLANIITFFLLLFTFYFNLWYAPYHKKVNIRATVAKVKTLAGRKDLVYSRSPLTFFEVNFYFPDRARVYVYNPENIAIPYYVGKVIIPEEKVISSLPFYPRKAFIINDDGSFEIAYRKS